jgi:hypothetical protein
MDNNKCYRVGPPGEACRLDISGIIQHGIREVY